LIFSYNPGGSSLFRFLENQLNIAEQGIASRRAMGDSLVEANGYAAASLGSSQPGKTRTPG
jgi:hypothetical protein